MTSNDPFQLLAMDDSAWPPDFDPVRAAARCFDPADPAPLLALLDSPDPNVSLRGLEVFAELGRKGAVVLDAALRLTGHPHDMARNALLDGVVCYTRSLEASQICALLPLAEDTFTLVREKVIIVLAYTDIGRVRDAFECLADPLPREHRAAASLLHGEPDDPQGLFDAAVDRGGIWSAYAFASLVRGTRAGTLLQPPRYAGDAYVPRGVVAHIEMLIRRRDFKRKQSAAR